MSITKVNRFNTLRCLQSCTQVGQGPQTHWNIYMVLNSAVYSAYFVYNIDILYTYLPYQRMYICLHKAHSFPVSRFHRFFDYIQMKNYIFCRYDDYLISMIGILCYICILFIWVPFFSKRFGLKIIYCPYTSLQLSDNIIYIIHICTSKS